jgi:hypothetical protein
LYIGFPIIPANFEPEKFYKVLFVYLGKLMIIKPPGRTHSVKWIKLSLNGFMALAYSGIGFFLLFSPAALRIIPQEYCTVAGISLVLYGFFRGFRAYLQFKNNRIF